MQNLNARLLNLRNSAMPLGLMAVSIAIAALAGYRTSLTPYSLVRLLVLVNVLLIGYMVILRNVYAGILIYFYSLVFLNYYWRIVIPGKWPDLDVPRLMFVFFWSIFLLEILLNQRRMLPNTAIEVMMLLVIAAITLSILLTGRMVTRHLLNGYAIPYAVYVLSKNLFTDRRKLENFIYWLAVPLALYFPLTAIFEHYRIMWLLFPRYIGKAVVGDIDINWGGRAMGAFIQPVATGLATIAIYVLAIHILSRRTGAFARIYSLIITLLTPIAIFFTYTRSVYLGYLLALVTLLVFSRKMRVTALIVIVALVLGVIGNWGNVTTADREAGGIGQRDTAQGRIVLATAAIHMFMDHPFFGVGFTHFLDYSEPYVSQVRWTIMGYKQAYVAAGSNQHNQFLALLCELGLSGFVPFVLLYALLLTMLVRARRVDAEAYDQEFVVAVWAIMAAYLAQVSFIEPGFFEFMNVVPFMLAGMVAGGYQRAIMRRAPSAGTPRISYGRSA